MTVWYGVLEVKNAVQQSDFSGDRLESHLWERYLEKPCLTRCFLKLETPYRSRFYSAQPSTRLNETSAL
jgi:hypothetical protein